MEEGRLRLSVPLDDCRHPSNPVATGPHVLIKREAKSADLYRLKESERDREKAASRRPRDEWIESRL